MAQIGIIKIKKLVDTLIAYVKEDYEAHCPSNTPESFIERCFDEFDEDGGVIYSETAKDIFFRDQSTNRKLETRLMFDRDRALLPTIHVREPAKSKGAQDGVGNMGEDFFINGDTTYQHERRRSFNSQFELMITSGNRHEVIIIEEVIVGLLLSIQDTIALNTPFYLFELSVRELMANNELIPTPLFIKSIMLNVGYDKIYPDITEMDKINRIVFSHNLLGN